jgi:hypothetical protein
MRKVVLLFALILSAVAVAENASLPPGTAVKIKLQSTLATFTNKTGDPFYGLVSEPVMNSNRVLIPAGSTVQGHITKISEPRRITGKPTIGLHPDTVTLPDGSKWAFNAVLVDTNLRDGSDVNEEGQFKGPGHDRQDTKETAVGAGGGVMLGALIGGAKGGVIGAGIGAGATIVHWLAQTRSATLPAGTELVLEISRPVGIGVTAEAQ